MRENQGVVHDPRRAPAPPSSGRLPNADARAQHGNVPSVSAVVAVPPGPPPMRPVAVPPPGYAPQAAGPQPQPGYAQAPPGQLPPPPPAPSFDQTRVAPTAPPAAPEKKPKEPGAIRKIGGFVRAWPKLFAAIVIAGAAYATDTVYQRRKPYEWAGTVEAKTVSIGSRVGGRVKEVLVKEGDSVKAGDPLIILEGSDLEAQRTMAEADLEASKANLDKLVHGARPEEIAQANARLAEARASTSALGAQAMRDIREAARAKSLANQGAISTVELEHASAQARSMGGSAAAAAAKAKEADAALRLLVGGARPEDISVAQAFVRSSSSKLALINTQIAELTIRAPSDARVESLTIRPGDLLAPNAKAAALLEAHQIYVRIYVPETLIGKIAVGQKVPIAVDSFPDRSFPGVIQHINQVGEFTPRSLQTIEERTDLVFAARVGILDGENDLRAGMTAFIKIDKKR